MINNKYEAIKKLHEIRADTNVDAEIIKAVSEVLIFFISFSVILYLIHQLAGEQRANNRFQVFIIGYLIKQI